jgi:hypothetical protein
MFLFFFRDTSNTCFDIVFRGGGSDLFDVTTMSEIPCYPLTPKKIGNFKLTREQVRYNGYMQISNDRHMDGTVRRGGRLSFQELIIHP